jgi:hypothetical protein
MEEKTRIHELAEEFGVESKAVMDQLKEMGEFVRSASATVEAPVVRRLKEAFAARNKKSVTGIPVVITIYLSDESQHQQVEAAFGEFLSNAGIQVVSQDDPIVGSWYRRIQAKINQYSDSSLPHEAAVVAAHAAEARLVLAQDAAITATMLQNLAPVIGALQPTRDAVIRAGALLIVKLDWVVSVHQLTARQQWILDRQPQLAKSPQNILGALELKQSESQSDPLDSSSTKLPTSTID